MNKPGYEISINKPTSVQLDLPAIFLCLWTLGKPRVVLVMLVCSMVGMLLARPVLPNIETVLIATIGIGLASMGAAAFNHYIDQSYDQKMRRTHSRPVASGQISGSTAIIYATTLSVLGISLLYFHINALTAYLTAVALIGYAAVYTAYLKHATPQNITIGGLAGAAPPLLGWTAITGQIDSNAILLVLIIFAWTPAHFWALAIHKKEEYASAGIPMLPVTHGADFTRLQIWLYTWLTIIASLLPFIIGMSGYCYLLLIIPLNLRWLWFNWKVYHPKVNTESKQDPAPMRAFWFSIRYLLYVFIYLLVDHFLYASQLIKL